ncbi:MAG: lipid-A-disaccharide synthase [Kiritimatiellae bacterium]|nr:lipid-A-disaccharide synthase [Kiritimatiellia bacterium]
MKILLLAGEESGAVYAERLKAEILKLRPDAVFKTYQDFFKTEDLGVFGIWEVAKRILFFLRVKRTMERIIEEWRPDRVVTIDYPGMNLKLARFAKERGIPAIHLVCPQVWAWHKNRIPKIPHQMTKLLCFFPFEPEIFKEYESPDFTAKFIGHPMADIFNSERGGCNARLPHDAKKRKVAILPGSRAGEVMRHTPRLVEAMEIVAAKVPNAEFVIPAANARAEKLIRKYIAHCTANVQVVQGKAREVLRACECGAVASGTATLEAALAGLPTVIVYAVGPFLAAFLRRAITGVKHVGLANIIAEKSGAAAPLPELLQENFTAGAVADLLVKWLADPVARMATMSALEATMRQLSSTSGALELAAKEITA